MSWKQGFIPICYRYFLLNQKKNWCEKCMSQISGPEMKEKGIEMLLPIFCSAWQQFLKIHINKLKNI